MIIINGTSFKVNQRITFFSYLKNTKTSSRNKLLDTNLSNQLMVVLETEAVEDFDPTEAIHLWNVSKVRRPRQEKSSSETSVRQINDTVGGSASTVNIESTDNSQMVVSSDSEKEQQDEQVITHEEMAIQSQSIPSDNSDTFDQEPFEREKTHEQCKDLMESEVVSLDRENKSDVNNNVVPVLKQDKLVGGDSPIPVFASTASQTEYDIVMNEEVEENYSSDCEFYENENDDNQFEQHIQYEERVKLAKKAYEEFLSLLNREYL